MRWLWRRFLARSPRRFPSYFGGVFSVSMLGLLAFPFTLGFGEPWWWCWIGPWLAFLALWLWWYRWPPFGLGPGRVRR